MKLTKKQKEQIMEIASDYIRAGQWDYNLAIILWPDGHFERRGYIGHSCPIPADRIDGECVWHMDASDYTNVDTDMTFNEYTNTWHYEDVVYTDEEYNDYLSGLYWDEEWESLEQVEIDLEAVGE